MKILKNSDNEMTLYDVSYDEMNRFFHNSIDTDRYYGSIHKDDEFTLDSIKKAIVSEVCNENICPSYGNCSNSSICIKNMIIDRLKRG